MDYFEMGKKSFDNNVNCPAMDDNFMKSIAGTKVGDGAAVFMTQWWEGFRSAQDEYMKNEFPDMPL